MRHCPVQQPWPVLPPLPQTSAWGVVWPEAVQQTFGVPTPPVTGQRSLEKQHVPCAGTVAVLPVGVQVSPATEQHRLVVGSQPGKEQHWTEKLLGSHVAPPVRQNAHLLAVPGFGRLIGPISDPPTLQMPIQHCALAVQLTPIAEHGSGPALAQTPLVHVAVQHCAAPSDEQACPFGLQAHFSPPRGLGCVKPWQHLSQPSFFPFFPRGRLAGHFLPEGIQASAVTVVLASARPCFLARAASPRPRAVSTEPASTERRVADPASRRTISSNVRGSTETLRLLIDTLTTAVAPGGHG